MMKIRYIFTLMISTVLLGCATKHYGRQGTLTGYEQHTLSCREIALEQAKVNGFIRHIGRESQFDGRSVLSFLGDFGIGNLLEKEAALESARKRLDQLQAIAASHNCNDASFSPSVEPIGSSEGQLIKR